MIAPSRGPRRPPILDGQMQVSVQPVYARAQSQPPLHHVFAYFVRIENTGSRSAQLFWRHWKIHDILSGDQEVEGEGVVGESPVLNPGDVHEYHSFCVLEGRSGHMEGFFHFRREDGSVFRARIERFELRVPRDDRPRRGPTYQA